MSAPTEKKQVKCGNCGELGHNKRTCPKNKPASESLTKASEALLSLAAPLSTTIYVITTAEWCNGRVDTYVTLCASADAVHRKFAEKVEFYNETYADVYDSSSDSNGRDHYPNNIYYRNEEQFTEITVPTKEQIETASSGRLNCDNVLVSIGDLGNAISFALQISVRQHVLHV